MTIAPHQRLVQQLPAAPFYCPVPPDTHPEAASLNEATVRWMLEQDLDTDEQQRRRLTLCDFGGLTASTMPYGRIEPLTLMARLHAVLFSLDDGLCDESYATAGLLAQETGRIMRAVEAPYAVPSSGESARTAALRSIRLDLGRHATPVQLRRWTEAMRVYTSGLVWEASWRTSTGLPSLDDYVTLWMRAIGMAPSTAMIEITGGLTLTDEELDEPRIRALTEIAWTLVSWDNDLYSRNKELLRADDDLNLIDVLAQEYGIDALRAQQEAVVMRDRVMVLFMRLRERALRDAGPQLAQYVDGLGQFVRGHLDWASVCPRYTVPGAPSSGPDGWWKRLPAVVDQDPLPLPSVSWWWKQLDDGQ